MYDLDVQAYAFIQNLQLQLDLQSVRIAKRNFNASLGMQRKIIF